MLNIIIIREMQIKTIEIPLHHSLKWLIAHQLCGHPFIIPVTTGWGKGLKKSTDRTVWHLKSADFIIV